MPIFGRQFRRGFRMQRMNWTQGGLCPLELWKGDAMRKSLYDYCRETGETVLLERFRPGRGVVREQGQVLVEVRKGPPLSGQRNQPHE